MIRRSEVEFFLRLHGLWEGVIALPPPPRPPFDLEKRRGLGGVLDGGEAGARRVSSPDGADESNMEPLDLPPQWGWSDDIEPPPPDWWLGDTPDPAWQEPEFEFQDDRTLTVDVADPFPPDEVPVFRWD